MNAHNSSARRRAYRLQKRLGQGGMAEVYHARRQDTDGSDQTCVVKRILPEFANDSDVVSMFDAEARITLRLRHPNIVRVFEYGKQGGQLFLAMEHIRGQDLTALFRHCVATKQSIPISVACHLASEIAAALAYSHALTDERGRSLEIVHRDVSPANVRITYDGEVKLLDFGIAKVAAHVRMLRTRVGVLKGKVAYMSPEQADGDTLDHRSDIFSLGVVLHEMLTLRRVFKGDDDWQTLRRIHDANPPIPSSLRSDVPHELDAVVMRMLARERALRFCNCDALRAALAPFITTDGTVALRELVNQLVHDSQPLPLLSTPAATANIRPTAALPPQASDALMTLLSAEIASLVPVANESSSPLDSDEYPTEKMPGVPAHADAAKEIPRPNGAQPLNRNASLFLKDTVKVSTLLDEHGHEDAVTAHVGAPRRETVVTSSSLDAAETKVEKAVLEPATIPETKAAPATLPSQPALSGAIKAISADFNCATTVVPPKAGVPRSRKAAVGERARRKWSVAITVLAASGIVLASTLLVSGSNSAAHAGPVASAPERPTGTAIESKATQSTATEPESRPTQPSAAAPAHLSGAPGKPAKVRLAILGVAGAKVFEGQRLLGTIPLDIAIEPIGGVRSLTLRKPGFDTISSKVSGNADVEVRIVAMRPCDRAKGEPGKRSQAAVVVSETQARKQAPELFDPFAK